MTKEQLISEMQESKVTGDESARWWNGGINRCIDLANKLDDPTDLAQLLEAAREAKDVLEEIAYNGDLKPLQEDKLRNLSSALKPFEK